MTGLAVMELTFVCSCLKTRGRSWQVTQKTDHDEVKKVLLCFRARRYSGISPHVIE